MKVTVLLKIEQPVGNETDDTEIVMKSHPDCADIGIHENVITVVENGSLTRYDPDKVQSILIIKNEDDAFVSESSTGRFPDASELRMGLPTRERDS